MRKPKNEIDQAIIANNETFISYSLRLKLIATSLFNWKGLDDYTSTGASKYLETSLYTNGKACFVKDKNLGFMALKVNPNGNYNVYGMPTKVSAYGFNYEKIFDFSDIVYIMNNQQEIPTERILNQFALRLYETERTSDTNIIAQKTPVLLEGNKDSMLTLKNIYEQYSGNTPFIFGSKSFDIGSKINSIKTDAPFIVDKLDQHKMNIWNEALTFLGINNANINKRERLISDEANSNNDLIAYYLNCFYRPRKEACDKCNEKFGTNFTVEINNDFTELIGKSNEEMIEMMDEAENDYKEKIKGGNNG